MARLTRYAVFAVVHAVVVLAAVSGLFGSAGALVVLVAAVPFLFAWGAYHADMAVNLELSETERSRWTIALWCVPWSMAYYWLVFVRGRDSA